MQCPFCDGSMSGRRTAESEGETGGYWTRSEYECKQCGGTFVHDLTSKIGQGTEAWEIAGATAPRALRGRQHCPECDALLISAWPPDAFAEPATGFRSEVPSRNERRTDHVCAGCGARYILCESIESVWLRASDRRRI